MGKKKDKKKGKGAEKTALKTEKKADKKNKKILKAKGEEDIEALIADFQNKDQKQKQTIEERTNSPSPRCNMTLTANLDRDELLMFGGEYFNGNKTFMYNDLYLFNTKNNSWLSVKAPGAPPPRCAHQAVYLRQNGGQLWIFGGEFASPTQSQFYHYKDLWVYHMKEKSWTKVSAPGGPSARSGHRMVACKRHLVIFGGFHDNIRDYKYFNDLHFFSLDTFTWVKPDVVGTPPPPRSGFQMLVSAEQDHILIYGGYSKQKLKKDVDKGTIHTDMYRLVPDSKQSDTSDPTNFKWKWQSVKQHGTRPSPRCGFTMAVTPGNKAVFFGGVFDEEEDEEHLEGKFFNEMYSLDVEKATWYPLVLRGKREVKEKKKRRKEKGANEEQPMEEEEEVKEDFERLQVEDNMQITDDVAMNLEGSSASTDCDSNTAAATKVVDDGVFTITMGSSSTSCEAMEDAQAESSELPSANLFTPNPRMNCCMAVRQGMLYLYGGIFEVGDKQYTLADMYSLDLTKLDSWNTIIAGDDIKQEYYDSSDDEDEACDRDEDDESDDEDMDEDIPAIEKDESLNAYQTRTEKFWLEEARQVAKESGKQLSEEQLLKKGMKFAEMHYAEETS